MRRWIENEWRNTSNKERFFFFSFKFFRLVWRHTRQIVRRPPQWLNLFEFLLKKFFKINNQMFFFRNNHFNMTMENPHRGIKTINKTLLTNHWTLNNSNQFYFIKEKKRIGKRIHYLFRFLINWRYMEKIVTSINTDDRHSLMNSNDESEIEELNCINFLEHPFSTIICSKSILISNCFFFCPRFDTYDDIKWFQIWSFQFSMK